jgi:hypothetical protein
MGDLFNNPMVNKALKSLSPQQIEDYRKIGEQMYGNIDFTDSKILNQMSPPIEEAVAYVEEGIKSGLLPVDLTEDEVALLSTTYGEKWYEKYGFKEHEVPEQGLSLKMKNDIEDAIKFKIDEANNKKTITQNVTNKNTRTKDDIKDSIKFKIEDLEKQSK